MGRFREENKDLRTFSAPSQQASLTFSVPLWSKKDYFINVAFFSIARWGNILHRIVWRLSQPHQPRVHVQWELQQQPAVPHTALLWLFIPTFPQWIPWFLTYVHQQQQLEFRIRRGRELIVLWWIPKRPRLCWKCTQFTQQISCHPY